MVELNSDKMTESARSDLIGKVVDGALTVWGLSLPMELSFRPLGESPEDRNELNGLGSCHYDARVLIRNQICCITVQRTSWDYGLAAEPCEFVKGYRCLLLGEHNNLAADGWLESY